MSQNWSLYALVKPYEPFWRMNIMMKICHLFNFKFHSLMKTMELTTSYFTVLLFVCFVCDARTTPQHRRNPVKDFECCGSWHHIGHWWLALRCLGHNTRTALGPSIGCLAHASLAAHSRSWCQISVLEDVAPLPSVEICWSNRFSYQCDYIVPETYNWVEVALWLICAPKVPLTEFKQNILCNSNCLFFLWMQLFIAEPALKVSPHICQRPLCLLPFQSWASPCTSLCCNPWWTRYMMSALQCVPWPVATFIFMCVALILGSLPSKPSIYGLCQCFLPSLPFTSFQLLTGGGNKAFVWNLDPRGVVLLSDTPGGGWEEDQGIKSLVLDIVITTVSFCGGNMMIFQHHPKTGGDIISPGFMQFFIQRRGFQNCTESAAEELCGGRSRKGGIRDPAKRQQVRCLGRRRLIWK